MTADLRNTVFEAFSDVMGERPPNGLDTMPDDVEMWTSLTHVHLIHELETRLGLTLPDEALVHSGPLKDLVESLRASSG